jgi:transposase InsO family protein
MGQITMSIKESNQVSILENLKRGTITQVQAAEQMGITDRQIRNKLRRFLSGGISAIVHRLRGKPSNNRTDPALQKRTLALVKNNYKDFGPTLAAEMLQEQHGIVIHAETLRNLMIKGGLWHVKAKRPYHRQWRERRAQFGHMVQLDGSPHKWLEERGPAATLLLFIDDATSKILWASFVSGESYENIMSVTKEYFIRHGLPLELYTDRGRVFKVNIHNEENDRITQFGRALKELNIRHIHARSPQAKGRVERCFRTLQNRLIKKLRIAGINTLAEANRYLQEIYLPEHNAKFAVTARQEGDSHRTCTANLDNILCLKSMRVLNADFTLRYRSKLLQIHKNQKVVVRPKESIMVYDYFKDNIQLNVRGTWLEFHSIDQRPAKEPKIVERKEYVYHRVPANHPMRRFDYRSPKTIQNGGYFR